MGRGFYIALEGAEGTGKSTHAARLATHLGALLTRETGGTDIGVRIRAILHDTSLTHLSHRAEALHRIAQRRRTGTTHLRKRALYALEVARQRHLHIHRCRERDETCAI